MEEGEQPRTPGYWQNFQNVETEFRAIAEKLGHFPTGADLKRLGLRRAEKVIYKKHGGMSAVRERLGYEKPTKEQHVSSLKRLINQSNAPKIQQMEILVSIDSLAESSDLGYSQREFLETYEGGTREDD